MQKTVKYINTSTYMNTRARIMSVISLQITQPLYLIELFNLIVSKQLIIESFFEASVWKLPL